MVDALKHENCAYSLNFMDKFFSDQGGESQQL